MRTLCAALVIAGAVCGSLSALTADADPRPAAHSLAIEVERPAGGPALLTFEVVADTPESAEALARETARTLGLSPRPSATAQWLPWSWKWDASELPVRVAYNPTGSPETVGPSVFIAGLNAWSTVESSSFRFHYAGITYNVASILDIGPDGENVISWVNLPCAQGCVLGVTSKESVHEVDMLLNSNPAAAELLGVGATVDWRTVVLHELGHMAGLEHSCPVPFGPCTAAEADAVMYYQYRGILRRLAADDVAGLTALYPASAPVPSPTPGGPPPPQATPTPFPEFPVILEDGWNFAVLPAGPVPFLTAPLSCIEAVYVFDGGVWRAWLRGLPDSLQELELIQPDTPYWLLASGACAHIFG